ncbi:MAG TPA: radical SAM protein [Candidatus Limnocylindria bacterium]|nr:radical SAM protein [Candidatus Limnocylindria bacterium]
MTKGNRVPKEEFIPKWLAWEVTGRCNLSCIHCRASSSMTSHDTDFTTAEARKLIDDITSFCSPVLVLSGGEPLLRPDLFEIAKYGTDKGLRMCIATNGTLVTDDVCAKMKESGIKIVSLSLDGSTAAVHDDFRKQVGAFEATLRAAETFNRNGIKFIVNSSFAKRNQHDIADTYRLAKKIGAHAWYMFMIVPTGRGEEIMSELISKEDYEEILEWHYQMEKNETDMLVRPTCAPHYYRVRLQKAKEEGLKIQPRTLSFSTGGGKGCICAQTIAFIDSKGNVQPCSYFPVVAGNVKKQHFRDIWYHSELFESLRAFEKYKGRCGDCEYLNVCGGCRARADAVLEDYLQEEPFCDYVPIRTKRRLASAVEDEKPAAAKNK